MKKEAHSGFNIASELNYWQQWCQLLGQKRSPPVVKAADMMNSEEENFMHVHRKLKYSKKGHVWLYLKAETKEDSEAMLKVKYQFLS